MKKLVERFTNLGEVSKKMLKYGLLIGIVFLLISNFLLKNANNIKEINIAREFLTENIYAICEIVVGALLLDTLIIKDDKNS